MNSALDLENKMDTIDSFLKEFSIDPDKFCEWCIKTTIWIEPIKAKKVWDEHINNIKEYGNVYTRKYGRSKENHEAQLKIYKKLNLPVSFDPTNNAGPEKVIREGTGKRKNKDIKNYKISHIFGLTKNPYAFMAPWNIAYTSILTDPFTGHESNHNLTQRITMLLREKSYNDYNELICEYNCIISEKQEEMTKYFETDEGQLIDPKLRKVLLEDFITIDI